jgi:hypothetical protein
MNRPTTVAPQRRRMSSCPAAAGGVTAVDNMDSHGNANDSDDSLLSHHWQFLFALTRVVASLADRPGEDLGPHARR